VVAAPTSPKDSNKSSDTNPSITAPTSSEIIGEIRVVGNRKIEKDAVITKLSSKVGEKYSSENVRDDVLNLVRMGYFLNVEVDRTVLNGKIILTFQVQERPSISEIKVEGASDVKAEDIQDASGLKAYEIFNQARMVEAIEKIQKFYEDKGFFLARVKITPEDIVKGESVKLKIIIEENEKVKVKKITFLGNRKVSENTLKEAMATKEGGFFTALSGSGQYKQEMFDRDVQMVRFSYYNKGYVQAKIDRPQVYVTPDKKSIYITIRVEEGEQYSVGEVDFAGDLLFSRDELLSSIQIPKNGVFAYDVLHKDIAELTAKYGDLGYAYANVLPRTRIDDVARKVDVVFEFDKGNKVYFGKIIVVGNSKTRDKVVRRELRIHEGELYNETDRRKSLEAVQRLGFFEEVNFKTSTDPEKLDVMNMDIVVKERNTGQISLAASYGTATGFGLQGSVQEINFLGKGQNLGASIAYTPGTSDASITFTEPFYNDSDWSIGYEMYRRTNTMLPNFNDYRLGGGITIGHPLTPESRYSFRLRSEDITLTDKYDTNGNLVTDYSIYPIREASGNTNSLTPTLSYDTRNDRYSPSKGMLASLSYEYSGIGGDVRFQRFNAKYQFFKNTFWDVVWRNSFSYSHIDSLESNKNPPFTELSRLGGPYSLRGYNMFEVGKTRRSERNYNLYIDKYNTDMAKAPAGTPRFSNEELARRANISATSVYGGTSQVLFQTELQFHLIKEANMFGVAFFDTGLADDIVASDKFYSDWGFGLRWFSPIGPLRFEIGFPLTFDDRPRESGVFQFSIGAPF